MDFLGRKNAAPQPLYVLTGEEDFLRRSVRSALEVLLLGDADPEFSVAVYPGDKADFSTIKSELDTLPFLSPRRVVVVEQADPFVSTFRARLEQLVEKPGQGTLILEVKTWAANTRLAKVVPSDVTIVCKPLPPNRMPVWCVERAATLHKKLSQRTAGMLVELTGPSLGMLDQELAKLAAFVGDRATITEDDVNQLVGRSRAAETFKIFEAVGAGRPLEAVTILQRLFEQGEEPMLILGAFSWQLRRVAQAARLARQGVPLTQALLRAGVREFGLASSEKLLKHLGWRRLDRLFDWLLEVDQGIKGSTPVPARLQIERLLVKLAQPRDTSPAGHKSPSTRDA